MAAAHQKTRTCQGTSRQQTLVNESAPTQNEAIWIFGQPGEFWQGHHMFSLVLHLGTTLSPPGWHETFGRFGNPGAPGGIHQNFTHLTMKTPEGRKIRQKVLMDPKVPCWSFSPARLGAEDIPENFLSFTKMPWGKTRDDGAMCEVIYVFLLFFIDAQGWFVFRLVIFSCFKLAWPDILWQSMLVAGKF